MMSGQNVVRHWVPGDDEISPFPVPLRGADAPTWMWAHKHEIDHDALAQVRRIAALPWVEGVRVRPDVHLGKGATVGSVIAMHDAVSPNAVGVDIGCGMIGVRTSLTAHDLPDDLGPLHEGVMGLRSRAQRQLGTLGGGNHVIEVCLDEFDGRQIAFDEAVNVHHNYVATEQIDGAELIVTRKGAIRAGRGDLGLIPGSMGTGSYVVRGLGNPASYCSASHGAGRRMSRGEAKQRFTLADLAEIPGMVVGMGSG